MGGQSVGGKGQNQMGRGHNRCGEATGEKESIEDGLCWFLSSLASTSLPPSLLRLALENLPALVQGDQFWDKIFASYPTI